MQKNSETPEQEKLKCPRCDSTNTKFCYYNNYNLSQPRHFCKSCRRYWTKGGALRNIPVGGGGFSRKNANRGSSAAVSAAKRPISAPASYSDDKNETLMPLKGDDFFGQGGQFGIFEDVSRRNETLLPLNLKGDDFLVEGQYGSFAEVSGKNEGPSGDDFFWQGQFGNFCGMSGSFSSLLVGSSSGAQFDGLFDGLGPNGPSLETSEQHFGDPDSSQNVDPQDDGFFNIGGDWPDLAI